ncbi:hypothetical protein JW899_02840 [Candidatus Uhrbacteria bacterium]|nr:hypothetical protein [Candidatus Uhrbacteria bacterium]
MTVQFRKTLDTLLSFNEGRPIRVGVRGSREYLNAILGYFRDRSFIVSEQGSVRDLGNAFPIPENIPDTAPGYVVVVDSRGAWDNHTMNKGILTANLGISDGQNAVFISWTSDLNETSGGGAEWDTSFLEGINQ